MTNEELNTALYEKMFAEQETYRAWLLAQASEEILNHTYEYTVREDILMSLEYNSLPNAQVRALLKSPALLRTCLRRGRTGRQAIWRKFGRLSQTGPERKHRSPGTRKRSDENEVRLGCPIGLFT